MAWPRLTLDTCGMDSILVYCRTRSDATETLRAWLEQQAAQLSADPDVRRTAVMRVVGQSRTEAGSGWLVECELTGASGSFALLRPLLADMRLVGLQPTVFFAERQLA
jgi:phage terminase large subunit-like protein